MANAPDGLVSIVMPTFNAERTLDRAIDSIVAQTYPEWELICIDDASSDGTRGRLAARARELGDRMMVLNLPENGGPSRARNRGLAACNGNWVAVLDSDDAWRPDRLRVLLDCAKRTAADAVCDNLMGYDDHAGCETKPLFQTLPVRLDIETTVAAEYQGFYNLGYLKPVMNRAFLRRNNLFYDESLRTGEDLILLLHLLAEGGSVACIDDALYVYTTPVGDTSRKLSRSTATSPRDMELASALSRFVRIFGGRSAASAMAAVEERSAYVSAIAAFSQFRHARLHRDWIKALKLLTKPDVRRHFLRSLRSRDFSAALSTRQKS